MKLKRLLTTCLLLTIAAWSFGQELLLDSVYLDVGFDETADFAFDQRTYYQSYDEDSRPLVVETQRYSEQEEWENWRRREYTYNEDGDLTRQLIFYWRPTLEEWSPFKERTYTYNDRGDVTSKQIRRALQPDGGPVNTKRWEYIYNGAGLQTQMVYQTWGGSAWVNNSRQAWNYNGNGLPIEQRRQNWDGSAWENAQRRLWNYTGGIVSLITEQSYDLESGEWINIQRLGYQNNGSDLWDLSVSQVWDNPTETWVNDRREVVEYTPSRNLDKQTIQEWDGVEWVNLAQREYQNDIDVMNVLTNQWSGSSSEWVANTRYQVRFNELGLRLLEQGWQLWSAQLQMWLNNEDTERRRYFYSEGVVSTEEPRPDADCRLPNPYRPGQIISCAELPQSGQFTVELVNGLGQVMYQREVAGGTEFSIDANLPQGWYLCRLRQGMQFLHLQPIVFIP